MSMLSLRSLCGNLNYNNLASPSTVKLKRFKKQKPIFMFFNFHKLKIKSFIIRIKATRS